MPGFLKVYSCVLLVWSECKLQVQATVEWFRVYKIPAGKPPNIFAFEGQAKDRQFAHRVVDEAHVQWKKLVGKQCDPGSISW